MTRDTIQQRQQQLDAFVARTVWSGTGSTNHARKAKPTGMTGTIDFDGLPDDERGLWEFALSRNDRFRAMVDDGREAADGDSDSERDFSLLAHAAFWEKTRGVDDLQERIECIERFARSTLWWRPKWDAPNSGTTVLVYNIESAIRRVDEDGDERDDTATAATDAAPSDGSGWESANEKHVLPVLDDHALYGVLGDVVRVILPHTEAAAAALLLQLMAGIGNELGPEAHVRVGATEHPARLYPLIAGRTSHARKGSGWNEVHAILRRADPMWANACIEHSLSTGEGLIARMTDLTDKKGNTITHDRRLLVILEEHCELFAQIGRQSSILSGVMRKLWDSGSASVLTRGDPLRVDGAHFSYIGHVTITELREVMSKDKTTATNGLGNRFLYAVVDRSKLLPTGGQLSDEVREALAETLAERIAAVREVREVTRTPAFSRAWTFLYQRFPDGSSLLAALTARAEAYVIRLSLLFALMDGRDRVDVPHLVAAVGLWDYCFASARLLFGESGLSREAVRLLRALRRVRPAGLDGERQSDALGGKSPTAARHELVDLGLIRLESERAEGRGRPRLVAYALAPGERRAAPGLLTGLLEFLAADGQRTGT